MRATAQNRLAAQLMGVNVERIIAATFAIGGALAGIGGFISVMYNPTVNFQMGYQNGLYAFTAAVLGGMGNIPGAVLGGLVIGLVRSLGTGYVGERWTGAIVFAILILILVFRPAGLLAAPQRKKYEAPQVDAVLGADRGGGLCPFAAGGQRGSFRQMSPIFSSSAYWPWH